MFKKSTEARKGPTAIEYAIIASMLSVVIIVGLEVTGLALKDNYEITGATLENTLETSAGTKLLSPNLLASPDAP